MPKSAGDKINGTMNNKTTTAKAASAAKEAVHTTVSSSQGPAQTMFYAVRESVQDGVNVVQDAIRKRVYAASGGILGGAKRRLAGEQGVVAYV